MDIKLTVFILWLLASIVLLALGLLALFSENRRRQLQVRGLIMVTIAVISFVFSIGWAVNQDCKTYSDEPGYDPVLSHCEGP